MKAQQQQQQPLLNNSRHAKASQQSTIHDKSMETALQF
jgi:hypothetical protein